MTDAELSRENNMDRRRFLQASATVAWATPLILTLTASRAGAATCTPTNAPCSACGTPCCAVPGDPFLCCCSSPLVEECDDPNQFCRSQAACIAQFPGGSPTNPDACFNDLPAPTMMRIAANRKPKYH